MRLGFVTFEGIDHDAAIAGAAGCGFDHVEIQMSYVAASTPELGRTYLAEREGEIRDLLDSHGVDLLVHLPHTMDIGATSELIREASVEETRECLRVAAALGAEKCVIHPTSSARPRVWEAEFVHGQILESIRELDDASRDLGVELCMENLYGGAFSIDDFDRFFGETDCSMTLDTGHARIAGMGEGEIAEFLESHGERVSHVHANDNKAFAGTDGIPGDDHVPTGSGDLDFATALEPIREGWDGTVSIEVHTSNLDYVAVSKRQFERMLG